MNIPAKWGLFCCPVSNSPLQTANIAATVNSSFIFIDAIDCSSKKENKCLLTRVKRCLYMLLQFFVRHTNYAIRTNMLSLKTQSSKLKRKTD